MTATILRADARSLPLADASVDLIVTSPPYWGLRDYRDGDASLTGQIGQESTPTEYVAALIDCTREWIRVLKPAGSLWVNLGDAYYSGKGAPGKNNIDPKSPARRLGVRPLDRSGLGLPRKSLVGTPWRYALACIDDLGLVLRAEIIWSKPNAMPEPSARDRAARSHETLLHLTQRPRYYADSDQRPDRSVWEIPTRALRTPADLGRHDAAMPTALAERIILGYSPPGGTVLDPFGGTGTTALVASVHGRHGISIDASADYCRLAAWRTTDPAERARALGVPAPLPVADDQDALFEVNAS
ncbi:DNA-methyltransferase [Spirillospora sp. NPDC127200]